MSILEKVFNLVESVPMGERDSWEQYFMAQAFIASVRATCGTRRVGAVIVDGLELGKRRILATGYNGNPPGAKHCIDGGCPRFQARKEGLLESGEYNDKYYCDAFHAEANALFDMQKRGVSTEGRVLFTTTFPCRACAEKINGAAIKKVYYCLGYPDKQAEEYLQRYNIETVKVEF
ncbi:deaminase [Priestia filamentosa]|uniref:deoxycytidylate deaminase n=1 Tax=Priestia filamentosa TaxID=1402861 RepID=UPI00397D3B5D